MMTPVSERIKEFRQNSLKIYREMEEKRKTMTTIVVHLGICGASVGAKEVLQLLKKKNIEHQTEDKVQVEVAGCLGLCSHEPIIRVLKPGMKDTVYCYVTEDMAEVIFNQHVINGVVIQPWVLGTKLNRR